MSIHRHCWFVEQQTGHTWCHLCGEHKRRMDEREDAAMLRVRHALSTVRRPGVNAIAGPTTQTPRGVR